MKPLIEIIQMFQECKTPEEKTQCLISLGALIPEVPNEIKPSSKISSCEYSIWLHGYRENDEIYYVADSDSKIAKGFLSILICTFSGQNSSVILNSNIDFIHSIDFGSEALNLRSRELYKIFQIMQTIAKDQYHENFTKSI